MTLLVHYNLPPGAQDITTSSRGPYKRFGTHHARCLAAAPTIHYTPPMHRPAAARQRGVTSASLTPAWRSQREAPTELHDGQRTEPALARREWRAQTSTWHIVRSDWSTQEFRRIVYILEQPSPLPRKRVVPKRTQLCWRPQSSTAIMRG